MIVRDAFLAAAGALERDGCAGAGAPLLSLLRWSAEDSDARVDRARLLRAAAGLARVFTLSAPDAPGLAVFGAEADLSGPAGEPGLPVVGASGVGTSPGEAFAACIGEAVELLSGVETAEDRAAGRATLPLVRWPTGEAAAWPVDLLLRRAAHRRTVEPPAPLSIGCAAGRSPEEAALRALLELIERDAAALWWRGGVPPRPVALEDAAEAAALLAGLREGLAHRRSGLLDITSDLGVPVVAALSFSPDGTGFCCGTACRLTRAAAARAAVLELCQNELAIAVVRAKREERGEAALNERDHLHLRRHRSITAGTCALLHPAGAPSGGEPPGAEHGADAVAAIGGRLIEHGLEPLLLDLTRPAYGIPVIRTACPGLACEPSRDTPPRLARVMERTGGGSRHTGDVPLY
ncbi:YcaO-like family protein [Muricoccus radiodurans]|uniref:YcaO-like family protein n=1 Tax=Muricoccus radiodurans TaxID=2231721 RepID=UPI003CF1CF6E